MPSLASNLAIHISRQRALPYRIRRSIIKRLHPPMLKDFAFETEYYGVRFAGNMVNYIDRLIYFCGGHEKYMLRFLRDVTAALRLNGTSTVRFMDIGANAGNHSLFMAKIADEVYAFEPFERVRAQLEKNIALNHLKNIRVFPFGLSDINATLPFYSGPETNLGSASFVAGHKQDNHYVGELEVRIGDEVAAQEGLSTISLLKADVEGSEPQVLAGLRETLRRDRPIIVCELSPTTRAKLGDMAALQALFPENYRFFYFAAGSYDHDRYRLAPFDFSLTPAIEDVIACPVEKTGFLQNLC